MNRGTLIALGLTAGTLAFVYSRRVTTGASSDGGAAKKPDAGGGTAPADLLLVPNEIEGLLSNLNVAPAALEEMILRLQRMYPGQFLQQLGQLQAKLINQRALASLGLVQVRPLSPELQAEVNSLLGNKAATPEQIEAFMVRIQRDYPDRVSDTQIVNLQARAIHLRALRALRLEEGVSELPSCPPGMRWIAAGSPDDIRVPPRPGEPWVYSLQQPPIRYDEATGVPYQPPRISVKGRCISENA